MRYLVIAEKPEVARSIVSAVIDDPQEKDGYYTGTFRKYPFAVTSAAGHLLRLAEPHEIDERYKRRCIEDLPIYENNWRKVPDSDAAYKVKKLNVIKSLLTQADVVINAGDPDDEGQLLIDELLEYYRFQGKVLRVLINDNLPEKIRQQFGELKDNSHFEALGRAALARQYADICFGINESRLAASRLGRYNLTIGRVQTPTLGLVVARDLMIENHVKTLYYDLTVRTSVLGGKTKNQGTDTGKIIGKTLDFKWKVPKKYLEDHGMEYPTDKSYAEKLKSLIVGKDIEVKTEESTKRSNAPLPYNLTVLQEDMNKRFGYSLKQTLDITQSLRDKRAITYNRSDCQYLSEEHFGEAKSLFSNILGGDFISKYPMDFKIHSKCFNDKNVTAHHAIIPQNTRIDMSKLTEQERNVYLAIAARYAQQFMKAEVRQVSTSTFTCNCEGYDNPFEYTAEAVKEPGWTVISSGSKDENDKKEKKNRLFVPAGQWTCHADSGEITEKETKPPQRYTEGSLVKDMTSIAKYVADPEIKELLLKKDQDKKGESGSIGTVATRAQILKGLLDHGLLEKNGKNIISTQVGRDFYNMIPENIKGADITAKWWAIQEDIKEGVITDPNVIMNSVVEVFNAHKDTAYEGLSMNPYGSRKKISGLWKGQEIMINATWGTYAFSEEEIGKLFAGEKITFTYEGSYGRTAEVTGELAEQEYKGKTFVGFKPDGKGKEAGYIYGTYRKKEIRFKEVWGGHKFTPEEAELLLKGKEISFEAPKKSGKGTYQVSGKLAKQKFKGVSFYGFKPDFDNVDKKEQPDKKADKNTVKEQNSAPEEKQDRI